MFHLAQEKCLGSSFFSSYDKYYFPFFLHFRVGTAIISGRIEKCLQREISFYWLSLNVSWRKATESEPETREIYAPLPKIRIDFLEWYRAKCSILQKTQGERSLGKLGVFLKGPFPHFVHAFHELCLARVTDLKLRIQFIISSWYPLLSHMYFSYLEKK